MKGQEVPEDPYHRKLTGVSSQVPAVTTETPNCPARVLLSWWACDGTRIWVFLPSWFNDSFVIKRDADFHLSIPISMRRQSLRNSESWEQRSGLEKEPKSRYSQYLSVFQMFLPSPRSNGFLHLGPGEGKPPQSSLECDMSSLATAALSWDITAGRVRLSKLFTF